MTGDLNRFPDVSVVMNVQGAEAAVRVKKTIRIQPVGFHSAVERAALELERYLPTLAEVNAEALPALPGVPDAPACDVVVGVSEHLTGLGLGALPRPDDADDALAILPKQGRLYLTGSNARSVLFAAYRLLEELGAVFLRPGAQGEVLPRRRTLRLPRRPIREKASYRHRGICIEGAPRLEHVLALLDWMAKKKMNAFQLQFRHSGVFWRRGYEAPDVDAAGRGKRLSDAECYMLDDRVIARVKELGMMLHRVGHGWTAFAAGLSGLDWEKTFRQPAKEKRNWLAMVEGKRQTWERIPLNTELCYSNPDVRLALVDEVIEYARRHPEVDYLHFWLSDGHNNKCECAACRKKPPSDRYAMLVNGASRRLKEERLSTRVVFLAYLDLLWPPARERIADGNVTFMYAPITRCFGHALCDPGCDEDFDRARPALNKCNLPRTNRAHADIARVWKHMRLSDSFVFDYHLGGGSWSDGFGKDLSSVMARDVKGLASLGLNGFMACHHVRVFYPLPCLPNMMAELLWNRRQSERVCRGKLMTAAFGRHAASVQDFFSRMVRAFRVGPNYQHGMVTDGAGDRARLEAILSLAKDGGRRFSRVRKSERDPVVRESLGLLAIHAQHAALLARVSLAALDRDVETIAKGRAEYESRLPGMLREFGPFIDPMIAETVRGACVRAGRLGGASRARSEAQIQSE